MKARLNMPLKAIYPNIFGFFIPVVFLFYIGYLIFVSGEMYALYLYQMIYAISWGILIYTCWKRNVGYQQNSLLWIIGFFSFLGILFNNIISYEITGNLFVFSEKDALLYDDLAKSISLSEEPFTEVLKRKGLGYLRFDDYGQILLLSWLYEITQSPLILNFYYWILSLFSAKYFFKICKNFMPEKFAFLSTLTFFTSSFYIWFCSSGLKESNMIFLIVMSYFHYYQLIKKNKIKNAFWALFFLSLILFFRPAVSILIFISMFGGWMLSKKLSGIKVIGVLIAIGVLFASVTVIEQQRARFVADNYSEKIEAKDQEGLIKGGVPFTLAVNGLSSVIGHFATINPSQNTVLSFYFSGLLLKTLMSIFYLFAIYFIIKNKYWIMLPILLFPLLESMSLIYAFEALELRKSLPHYPMMYILIFWGFYQLNRLRIKGIHKITNNGLMLYNIICFILIIAWNTRNL